MSFSNIITTLRSKQHTLMVFRAVRDSLVSATRQAAMYTRASRPYSVHSWFNSSVLVLAVLRDSVATTDDICQNRGEGPTPAILESRSLWCSKQRASGISHHESSGQFASCRIPARQCNCDAVPSDGSLVLPLARDESSAHCGEATPTPLA